VPERSVRYAFTADWHLSGRGGPDALEEVRRVAEFIGHSVADADPPIDVLLHGGDLFDSARPTPTERRVAIETLAPVLRKGIPIVVIAGNHDLPRSPADQNAIDVLREVRGLTIVDRPEVLYLLRGEDGRTCIVRGDAGLRHGVGAIALQIACFPWPRKNLLLQQEENRRLEPGELALLVRQNVEALLSTLEGELDPSLPSVLLAHATLDQAEAGSESRLMLLSGEMTLNLDELARRDFGVELLGHIHKPQDWYGKVYYAGAPQATNFGEADEEKCYLLGTIRGDPPAGREYLMERVATPYRHHVTMTAALAAAETDEVMFRDLVRDAVVRIVLPADYGPAGALVKRVLAAGAHSVALKQIPKSATSRHTEVAAEMSAAEALAAWRKEAGADLPELAALLAEARSIEEELVGGAR
jgi:exonuclease SbcD